MRKIQLSIPEPCHEHWDDMTPTQQGRFCNACAKEVIDFSRMSDTEVLRYFSKVKENKVCGRAWSDQLDRTITALPGKKFHWYLNYVIAFFLLFGKAGSSKAQSRKGMMIPKRMETVNSLPKETTAKKLVINDMVADEYGQPIPFASIKILNSPVGVSADENGRFTLNIDRLNCSIEVSALNYETKQVVIYDVSERAIVLTRSNQLMEEVVISNLGYVSCSRMAGGMMVSVVEKRNIFKDTLQNWISALHPTIKIYPNPVSKGALFNVTMKLKQPGNYVMQLTDAAGRLVEERKIKALSKEQHEQLQSSNRSAGIYYIKVIDEKGKSAGTGSLAIQ